MGGDIEILTNVLVQEIPILVPSLAQVLWLRVHQMNSKSVNVSSMGLNY